MTPSIAFLLAAVLLVITPGPGLAYVVMRAAAAGRAEGLLTCAGTAIGGLAHVLAAAVGVSALVAESAIAFSIVKYLGAAYLVWLGIGMLRHRSHGDAPPRHHRRGRRRALVDGAMVELLNVKTALFFLAFLPQFANPEHSLVPQLVVLGSIVVAFNTLVDVGAVLMVHRILEVGSAGFPRSRWIARVCGFTMVGLGAYLALARRGPHTG